MGIAIVVIGILSLLFSLLLLREFLNVTYKRRMLIAALGGSGRAVRSFKYTIITTYILLSILWSVGLPLYYFWLFIWS
ncbi:MAG: hypothetical protein ABIA92_03350 [Patescibacteria group bacterium]